MSRTRDSTLYGVLYLVKGRTSPVLGASRAVALKSEGPPEGGPSRWSCAVRLRRDREPLHDLRDAGGRVGGQRCHRAVRAGLLPRDVERDRDRPTGRRAGGVHLVLRTVGRSCGDVRAARPGPVLGAPVDAGVAVTGAGVAGVATGAVRPRDVLARRAGAGAAAGDPDPHLERV